MRNQDLGFNKDAMLLLPTNGDTAINNHLDYVKNEFKELKGVRSVSASATVPGQSTNNLYTAVEITDGKMSPTNINYNFVDHDYITTYDIKLVAGRNFSREVKADDTTAFIINETGMKDFGWTPEQAIGKKVKLRQRRKDHRRNERFQLPITSYESGTDHVCIDQGCGPNLDPP